LMFFFFGIFWFYGDAFVHKKNNEVFQQMVHSFP
jgi:hypothetical protein